MLSKNIINIIFNFLLFFGIFIVLVCIFFKIVLNKDKDLKKFSALKTKVFGLFMEIDNFTIFALSVNFVRFVFSIYSLFFVKNLSIVNFYVLIFLSILFGVSSRNVKNLLFEIFSSYAFYFGLFLSNLLIGYLTDIRFVWYIFLGNIFLNIFLVIYLVFFVLRNMIDVISKSRYIRRERNDED